MPRFPVNDNAERMRFLHHLECAPGWEYKTTSVFEKDLPGAAHPHGEAYPLGWSENRPFGWDFKATRPEGFHINADLGIGYDADRRGHTKIAPGVIRRPDTANGPMLVAHWRRKRR